jgi:hypothetical protein
MNFLTLAIALSASLFTTVAAHGYVKDMNVDGKTYEAWKPFADPYVTPIPARITRKFPDDGPVTDYTSKDMLCNKNAPTTAGLTADATPGAEVVFNWQFVGGHKGPINVYLADCGASCDGFDGSSGKVWFKIAETGLITAPDAAGNGGYWASDKLMEDGGKWTINLPKDLAAGNYLMRHEILAMHSAGAPQFYPSCSQLKVSGSGSAKPSTSDLVAIPQVYSDSLDAIKFNIWSAFSSYTPAGPPVASLASTGSGTSAAVPSATSSVDDNTVDLGTSTGTVAATTTASSVRTTTTPVSAPATTTGTHCKAKKRAVTNAARDMTKRHVEERKRRLSNH